MICRSSLSSFYIYRASDVLSNRFAMYRSERRQQDDVLGGGGGGGGEGGGGTSGKIQIVNSWMTEVLGDGYGGKMKGQALVY